MRRAAGSIVACAALAITLAAAPALAAQPFYKDKAIRIIISTGVAGGYMGYARTLSEHMGAVGTLQKFDGVFSEKA